MMFDTSYSVVDYGLPVSGLKVLVFKEMLMICNSTFKANW